MTSMAVMALPRAITEVIVKPERTSRSGAIGRRHASGILYAPRGGSCMLTLLIRHRWRFHKEIRHRWLLIRTTAYVKSKP